MKNTFTSSSSQATDLLQAQGGQDVLLALALLLKMLHLDEQHDSWTETPSAQVEQWEFVICQFLLNIVHQQIKTIHLQEAHCLKYHRGKGKKFLKI